MEQGFLKRRGDKPIHGVELFRIRLLRNLLARGIDVTLGVERSWRPIIRQWCTDAAPEFVAVPNLGGVLSNAPAAVVACARRRFDVVLFGDPGRGMIPAMRIARMLRLAPRHLVFAHRRPDPSLVRFIARMGLPVVVNSEYTATRYRQGGVEPRVCYGLAEAEAFHPASEYAAADASSSGTSGSAWRSLVEEGYTHFVLLARLPNVSKGHRKAVEAFSLLPNHIRARCRLHLASFVEDPDVDQPGVICHRWIPADEIPDFLRCMNVMLCLSRNETFSQAIVQGMLTALPVIATRVPVFLEKLDAGGGIHADEPAEIAEAMARLAGDPQLRARMGAAARRTALDRYIWDTDRFLRDHLLPGNWTNFTERHAQEAPDLHAPALRTSESAST